MKVILHLATLFTVRPPPQNCVDQTVVSQYSSHFTLGLSILQFKPVCLMQKFVVKHLFIISQVTA